VIFYFWQFLYFSFS